MRSLLVAEADAFDDAVAFDALEQQPGQFPPEAAAQAKAFVGSGLPASLDDFRQELRVGGEGDVFFLDRGAHRDSTSLASSPCSATETSTIRRAPSSPIRLRK
jgi:hypothetical protein